MIQEKLSIETKNQENIIPAHENEKVKLLESRSPTRIRVELSPLPKLEQINRSHPNEAVAKKTISEFQSYGAGNIELLCCRFDQDDHAIATGSSDGFINIYVLTGTNTGKHLHALKGASDGSSVTCMRWRPHTEASKSRQILVTGCADGSVTHWHAPSGKLLHRIIEKDNQILALDYDVDGSSFATAGKDTIVRVYDENTKSIKAELSGGFWQFPGHSNRIFSLKFHPEDPNIILSAGWDNTVYFWDIRDGHSFGNIFGPEITGDSLDLKGGQVLTGSWRNRDQLELWDYGSRKKITTIDWEFGKNIETAYVYACQFSKTNDEDIIAGCSNLNEVKLFDRKTGRDYGKFSNIEKGVFSVDFANNSDTFSFCGGDGRVHLAKISAV